jgi:hypothetical protein
MKDSTRETVTGNETILQADTLTDLPVPDEQADRATGGVRFDTQGRLLIGTEGGIW